MAEPSWRVVVGSDDAGEQYRRLIVEDLRRDPRVTHLTDLGVNDGEQTAYPSIGVQAAELVAAGEADRAVLVCGTGIGMAISANKVPGIRATTAHDPFSVERSVLSNNCQVLTLGQRVIGPELARRLVREWLGYVFDPTSPSRAKLELLGRLEQRARAAHPVTERAAGCA